MNKAGEKEISKPKNIYDGVRMEQYANATQLISNATQLISSATRYDSEMKLTDPEKIALARILAYEGVHEDGGHFAHAVDFLWMAHRISTASKMMLMDLMNDSQLLYKLNYGEEKGEHI